MKFYRRKYMLTKKNKQQSDLGHVNLKMVCEVSFITVSFGAYVAIERLFPSVLLHVAL